jgi:hypothetical protein
MYLSVMCFLSVLVLLLLREETDLEFHGVGIGSGSVVSGEWLVRAREFTGAEAPVKRPSRLAQNEELPAGTTFDAYETGRSVSLPDGQAELTISLIAHYQLTMSLEKSSNQTTPLYQSQ